MSIKQELMNENINKNKKYVNYVINLTNKYVLPYIESDMSVIKLLDLFINNFKSDHCKYSKKVLRKKIISHSNRVYKNATIIMSNLELNHKIYFSQEDRFIMCLSCMFHDIGKVHDDDNHNMYSTIITEHLLSLDSRIEREIIDKILEIIYFHTKKNKHKNKISLMAKILRDADLFDEECGDSLLYLLLSKIDNEKEDLNKLKIKEAKQLLSEKVSSDHKNEIESKINTPGGKELYNKLLNETVEKFYLYIDYIDDYDEDNYYYHTLKYNDCLKIKIK